MNSSDVFVFLRLSFDVMPPTLHCLSKVIQNLLRGDFHLVALIANKFIAWVWMLPQYVFLNSLGISKDVSFHLIFTSLAAFPLSTFDFLWFSTNLQLVYWHRVM